MVSRRALSTQAWGALLQIHATLVPTLDRAVQAAGLPLSWYDVLLELADEADGRLRMSDLAERVVLSRSRVSRVVDELVASGFVVKQEHPNDRRAAFAAITKAGRAAFTTAAPVYVRAIEAQFAASLTNDELDQLGRILNKINSAAAQRGSTARATAM